MNSSMFAQYRFHWLLLALLAMPVRAATVYWDGGAADIAANGNAVSAGGGGVWDATTLNWDTGAVAHVAWNNDANSNDTASFGGTAGAVTAAVDLVAGRLVFGVANYTLVGSNYNLTLNGTGATITGGKPTTIQGFGTIILGANQTWDTANDSSYAVRLTVTNAAGGAGGVRIVNNNGYNLTLGHSSPSAYVAVYHSITGTGGLVAYSDGGIASAKTILGSSSNSYIGNSVVYGYITIAALKNAGLPGRKE